MNLDQRMQQAMRLHQAGRLAEAEAEYSALLLQTPGFADALHLQGVARSQLGRHDEAVRSLQQAVQLRPNEATWQQNLGKALLDAGQPAQAEQPLLRAVSLDSNLVEAHFNLGNLHKTAERYDEARNRYLRVIQLRPDHARAWNNLGNTFQRQERWQDAEQALLRALRLKPDYAEAHLNYGIVLNGLKRHEEALVAYQQSLRLKPELSESHLHRGIALLETGRTDEAIEAFQMALAREPELVEAHNNLGNAWSALNQLDAAEACYLRAVELRDSDPANHFNLAMLWLRRGDYARGWHEYEWGLKGNTRKPIRDFPQPRWDGGSHPDQTLLVYAEQGVGDTLQFLRYLPRVKAAFGGRVLVETQIGLATLVARCAGVDQVVERQHSGVVAAPFDHYVAMMSLPAVLGDASAVDIPATSPYLSAEPGQLASWAERLRGDSLKIGLVWAGNPEHRNDHNRSCPLLALAPLIQAPEFSNVRWYSLQVGVAAKELAGSGLPITDLAPQLRSYEDTAAAVLALDLVISVDTSVAHLAGGLDRPLWLMLPYAAEWRWQMERADTPWYRSARLFRQTACRDWSGVVTQLMHDLRELACRFQAVKRGELSRETDTGGWGRN